MVQNWQCIECIGDRLPIFMAENAWEAPELDLRDNRRLGFDAPEPFPEEEEWGAFETN